MNTKKDIKWFSINKKIVSVSKKGVIKAKKKGKAIITANVNGKKYTFAVTVYKRSEYLYRKLSRVGNDKINIFMTSSFGETNGNKVLICKLPNDSKNSIDGSYLFNIAVEVRKGANIPHPYYYVYLDKMLNSMIHAKYSRAKWLKKTKNIIKEGVHTVEVVCYEHGDPDDKVIVYNKLKYKIVKK